MPDESNTAFMMALQDYRKILPVITPNDQGASFPAGGYSRVHGDLGIRFAGGLRAD